MECEYVFKIILLGNTGVGKTCFLERLIEKHYNYRHDPTIGVDFRLVYHKTDDDKSIKCHIWDTAGQEQFRSITRQYYKGAGGIILMYDTTNMKSFKDLKNWLEIIDHERGLKDLPLILVGTKTDKIRTQVPRETAQVFAYEHNMDFFEISAKTGENITKVIPGIANKIKTEIVDKNLETSGVRKMNNISEDLRPYTKARDDPNHWYKCCTIS